MGSGAVVGEGEGTEALGDATDGTATNEALGEVKVCPVEGAWPHATRPASVDTSAIRSLTLKATSDAR